MNSDIVIHILLAVSLILIVESFGVVAYAITLRKELKAKTKEVARLRTMLKREQQKEPLCIVQDGRHPKFGGF